MSNLSSTTNGSGLTSNGSSSFDDTLHQTRITVERVLGICLIIMMMPIFIGNILTVLAICKFRSLRTPANIFIVSLSCADILVGLTTSPLYALLYIFRYLNRVKYLCILKFFFVLMSMSTSLFHLAAIAYDRHVAIHNPLKYHVIMTKGRARAIVVCIWIYNVAIMTVSLYVNNFDPSRENPCNFFRIFPMMYTALVSYVSILLLKLFSFSLYLRIFLTAKKNRETRLQRKMKYSGKSLKQLEKDTKSAKVMALILFLFFMFWLPLLAVGPFGYLDLPEDITEVVKNCALSFAVSNSFVNPIIYCWMKPDFKAAFKSLLGIQNQSSSVRELTSSVSNEVTKQENEMHVDNRTGLHATKSLEGSVSHMKD